MAEIHYPIHEHYQAAKMSGVTFVRAVCGLGCDLNEISLDPEAVTCMACIAVLREQGELAAQQEEVEPDDEPLEPGGLSVDDDPDEPVDPSAMVVDDLAPEPGSEPAVGNPAAPAVTPDPAMIIGMIESMLGQGAPSCDEWKDLIRGGTVPSLNVTLSDDDEVETHLCIPAASKQALFNLQQLAAMQLGPVADGLLSRLVGMMVQATVRGIESGYAVGLTSAKARESAPEPVVEPEAEVTPEDSGGEAHSEE